MAWPTPTLDEVILTENSNGRRWLHALCRALNQREGCLGLTKTEFMIADGSEAADPEFDDFLGLWVGGENDGAITNLGRCMTGLKAMLTATDVDGFGSHSQFFDESGSGGSGYTLSSLQTAVGLGSFPDAPESWADLNFWKQLQQAFDLLIYCRKQLPITRGTVSERLGGGAGIAASWAAAYADSPSTVGGGSFLNPHLCFVSDGTLTTFREGPTTIAVNSSALAGVLTESFLQCQLTVNAHGSGFPDGWTIESVHVTSTVNNALVASSDINLGENTVLAFDCDDDAPATSPVVSAPFQAVGTVYWADLYYDIAGELEDQA